MLSKRLVASIIIAGALLLSVSSIPMGMGLATQADVAEDEFSLQDPQAASAYLYNELQISAPSNPEAERYLPAVAYNSNHDEYLVVWHNVWPGDHRDIYARRVTASGKLLSWFAVSVGPNDRAQPDVVYNAATDEYLIVWMYNANGDGTTYEIWGRTIAWNGAYQNPEFQIITWPNRSFWTPRVDWNSVRNEYMVVWNAINTITTLPNDVSYSILSANGSSRKVGTITNSDLPHEADVAFNASKDEYMVVWRRMTAITNADILAARVSGGPGMIVNPPGVITISDTSEDQRRPAIATNQSNRYVVAWSSSFGGSCCVWYIHIRQLDSNGNLLGLNELQLGFLEEFVSPAVAARSGTGWDHMVAFQQKVSGNEQVWAYYFSPNGDESMAASAAFWDHETPAIGMGKVSSLLVYTGDNQGDPNIHKHIYGHIWVPNIIYLPVTLYR